MQMPAPSADDGGLVGKQCMHLTALVALVIPVIVVASPIGRVTGIAVTKSGIGPAKEGCAAFSVTPDQVRAFLDKAVLISGSQQHDFFLHGPCAARGTLQTRYDTWQWEIRNLGTATITATNGDTFVLGNPEQESSLADDGSGP